MNKELLDKKLEEYCKAPANETILVFQEIVGQNVFAKLSAEKVTCNKLDEAELSKIDTTDVEAMVYVMPMTNVLREDARNQAFDRKDLLKGAPRCTEDSWQVPRLVK